VCISISSLYIMKAMLTIPNDDAKCQFWSIQICEYISTWKTKEQHRNNTETKYDTFHGDFFVFARQLPSLFTGLFHGGPRHSPNFARMKNDTNEIQLLPIIHTSGLKSSSIRNPPSRGFTCLEMLSVCWHTYLFDYI
jgi:hypothetical protein